MRKFRQLSWVLLPIAASAAPSFYPPLFFELSGTDPSSLALADFDRDGVQDVAVAMYGFTGGDGKVSLHMGDGTGSLSDHPFPLPFRPYGIAACDLDGDNRTDLAVTEGGDGRSVHLYRNDGSGAFSPAGEVSVGARFPAAVTCSDLNRDGYPDLAVASAGDGGVAALFGEGAMRFSPLGIDAARHFKATTLLSTDIDLDGLIDLILPQAVLRNIGGDDFELTTSLGGDTALSGSDINSDGFPDLAVAGRDGINIWTGGGPASLPLFFQRVEAPGVAGLSLHDFDRDGEADLIFTQRSSDQITLRAGRLAGSEAAVTLAACTDPGPLAVGDADGNGLPDVFAACRGLDEQALLVVLLQRPASSARPGLGFVQARYDITESAGSVAIAVRRSDISRESRVAYQAVSETALPEVDFALPPGTLYFAPGVASQEINVAVRDDTIAEPTKTFRVSLFAPENAELGIDATNIVLHDDDSAVDTPPNANAGGGGPNSPLWLAVSILLFSWRARRRVALTLR